MKFPNAVTGHLVWIESLLRFFEDGGKDPKKLGALLNEALALGIQSDVVLGVQQAQPVTALFGLLARDFDAHAEIFLAQRLVRLDVVGAGGTGGSYQLPDILKVAYRSRQSLHKRTNAASELYVLSSRS